MTHSNYSLLSNEELLAEAVLTGKVADPLIAELIRRLSETFPFRKQNGTRSIIYDTN